MQRFRSTSQTQKSPIWEGMNTRSHLRRSLLILARAMWIVFAICNLISLPFGIQWSYAQTLAAWRSEPIVAQALTQIHLTASQGAASFTVIYVLASLVFLMIGFLIIWRLWGTSNELLGLLTSFIFITIGGTGITGIFTGFSGPPNPVLQIIFFVSGSSFSLLFPCLAVFLMIFPNGRFAPRWSWILIILWIIQGILFWEFFSQNIFLPLLPRE